MIASLCGQVQQIDDDAVIVTVHGVGFRVHVASSVLDGIPRPGVTVDLLTEMIARENDISLYGFITSEERDLFRLLLGISGVGPRTALGVLSTFSPDTLRNAVAQDDVVALTRIPGIGRKTAQRLVLDLKDRIGAPSQIMPNAMLSQGDSDVLSALTALGYSVAEAQAAIVTIPEGVTTLDERILSALRALGS